MRRGKEKSYEPQVVDFLLKGSITPSSFLTSSFLIISSLASSFLVTKRAGHLALNVRLQLFLSDPMLTDP